MTRLSPVGDRFALDPLAERIRRSSNFRFAWQFYEFSGLDPRSPNGAANFLNLVAQQADCHAFLRRTFDPMYEPDFEIAPVACMPETSTFEQTLAAAACDRLGAYSSDLRDPPAQERLAIDQLFRRMGPYCAFGLEGEDAAAFTNWFFGVAWDWCFLLTWPPRHLAWLGCLTDTD